MLLILYHRNGDLSQAMVKKIRNNEAHQGREIMTSHKDSLASLTRQGTRLEVFYQLKGEECSSQSSDHMGHPGSSLRSYTPVLITEKHRHTQWRFQPEISGGPILYDFMSPSKNQRQLIIISGRPVRYVMGCILSASREQKSYFKYISHASATQRCCP